MISLLRRLKDNGFAPKRILDLGAEKGTWTQKIMPIFPTCEYTLIEPIEYNELNALRTNEKINIVNVIVNNYDGEVDWYEMKNTGDSINRERTHHFSNCKPIKKECKRLDSLYDNTQVIFDLVKMDVQGAEINVIDGGKKLLANSSFIILEIPFMGQYNENTPNFLEHIVKMDELGFVPFDIVDQHRADSILLFQVDVCFINKRHKIAEDMQIKINNMGRK